MGVHEILSEAWNKGGIFVMNVSARKKQKVCEVFIDKFVTKIIHKMSRAIGKPAFCICKYKGTDQLHSNCTADQRLFCYIDTTIHLLLNSEIFCGCTARFVFGLV